VSYLGQWRSHSRRRGIIACFKHGSRTRARDGITSAFVTSPPSRAIPGNCENCISGSHRALGIPKSWDFPVAPKRRDALSAASRIASCNAKVFCSRGRGIIYRSGESNPGMISGSIHSAGELREYYPSKRNTIRVSMHSNEHSSRPLDGFISNQRSRDLQERGARCTERALRGNESEILRRRRRTEQTQLSSRRRRLLKLNIINFHVYYCRVH